MAKHPPTNPHVLQILALVFETKATLASIVEKLAEDLTKKISGGNKFDTLAPFVLAEWPKLSSDQKDIIEIVCGRVPMAGARSRLTQLLVVLESEQVDLLLDIAEMLSEK